ncbi:MAG: glycosyltransferase [Actinomycetota bacterium]|nr:glycosyltransferase [Actinomycetota bacterium]
MLLPWLRRWDFNQAQKVDVFVANSHNVRARIRRYYARDALVVYPPVNTARLAQVEEPQGRYYLVLGHQVAYKRLDLAVDAFNELGLPLLVAGDGEEIARQRLRAKPNISFRRFVPEAELPRLYGDAIALIFPGEEDFGIVPVEAMAVGTPVIAYGRGGAAETVIHGQTGSLFSEQSVEALARAVSAFDPDRFDRDSLRKHAAQFSAERFSRDFKALVDEEYRRFVVTGHRRLEHGTRRRTLGPRAARTRTEGLAR